MFDNLKCEYPLPRPEFQDREFQTKSFEREMKQYTITSDGRLTCLGGEWQGWTLVKGTERVDEVKFDGDVYFYDFVDRSVPQNQWQWIEFRARFQNGILEQLEEVPEKPLSKEQEEIRRSLMELWESNRRLRGRDFLSGGGMPSRADGPDHE